MNELRELYQQIIIDHSRHPHNFGQLDTANRTIDGFNPLCGDKLTLYLEVKNDCVENISFIGHGCAISTASASLMTDAIKGKTVAETKILFDQFHKLLTEKKFDVSLGKLDILAGVCEFPTRIKCATLAWHALKSALENQPEPISTE